MSCEKDFPMKRYGISVRLVEEDDAEFILKLRTNRKLSRYLHKTDADIEKQIQWIRNYKKRELELYFNKQAYSKKRQVHPS